MTQYLAANGVGEHLTLGGLRLPGVVTSIEVRGQYEIERKKVAGLSGTTKLGHGYNDAQVTVNLEILPPDEYGQIKEMEAVFKAAFGVGGKPKPVRVVSQLLDSRDVTSVLFQNFTVYEGNEDDALQCVLELLEFEPLPRINERKQKQKQKVVSGPQGLPTGEAEGGGGAASAQQELPGFRAGGGAAFGIYNAVPNALGLQSNTPPPSALSEIAAGGPLAEKFINDPDGLK